MHSTLVRPAHFSLCCAVLLMSCSDDEQPPPTESGEQGSRFDDVIAALGGQDALSSLSGIIVEASGETFVSDQGIDVGGEFPISSDFNQRLSVDLDEGWMRSEYVRDNYVPFSGFTDYSEIVRGELGYLVGQYLSLQPVEGPIPMESDRRSSTVRVQNMMVPHVLLRSFLNQRENTRELVVSIDGESYPGLELETEGPNVVVVLSSNSDEVIAVQTLENHYLRGDVVVQVDFGNWQTQEGSDLRFPDSLTLSVDGEILHSDMRSLVEVNPSFSADFFDFPLGPMPTLDPEGSLRGFENAHYHYEVSTKGVDFFDGPRDEIEVKPQAEGVSAVGKDEYFTYVIEQSDGLVIVDPSLYPGRARAIFEWIDEAYPNKPITHAVITHFHKDHAGALREYVKQGAAVVVAEAGRPFFEDYLGRSAMIAFGVADGELSPEFIEVGTQSQVELADPLRPLTIYQVSVPHSNDTLIVRLENENVTLFADMYASWQGDSASAISRVLVELGLDETAVGIIHGGGNLIPPGAFGAGGGGGAPPGGGGGGGGTPPGDGGGGTPPGDAPPPPPNP